MILPGSLNRANGMLSSPPNKGRDMTEKIELNKSVATLTPNEARHEDETDENIRDKNVAVKDPKRIAPRRKPEKSRIMRVWPPNDENCRKACPHCTSEFETTEERERHVKICERNYTFHESETPKSMAECNNNPLEEAESIESPSNDSNFPSTDSNNLLKLFRNSIPGINPTQQLALEVILKAQMSMSRGNSSNNEEDSTDRPSPLAPEHQQQLLHLQLLQLLQAQLAVNGEKRDDLPLSQMDRFREGLRVNESSRSDSTDRPRFDLDEGKERDLLDRTFMNDINKQLSSEDDRMNQPSASPTLVTKSISSLVIHHPDSPPPVAPNTLEMLQKTADEVLNNASKGLLASRLIDSCREADNRDPNKRHRCRYCGKVFSSDSGLQIHIRSHTGERPFKCNVCGNRFTTKGNLKVHFQRHSDQFPNLKMNSNPIPEHLDKFYPPILPPNSDNAEDSTPLPVTPTTSLSGPSPLTSLSPQFKPNALFPPRINFNFKSPFGDDLLKSPTDSFAKDIAKSFLDYRLLPQYILPNLGKSHGLLNDETPANDDSRNDAIKSTVEELTNRNVEEDEDKQEESRTDPTYNSIEKKDSNDSCDRFPDEDQKSDVPLSREENQPMSFPEPDNSLSEKENSSLTDREDEYQPLNLVNNSTNDYCDTKDDKYTDHDSKESLEVDGSEREDSSLLKLKKIARRSPSFDSPAELSHLPYLSMPVPPNISLLQRLQLPFSGPSISQANHLPMPSGFDPSRTPHIYTNLLPRPGSTDNSWEALIEVEKSNENQKIEQLIDKSKEKATEPNQCAICQRVLSCKSALQMHYRIHTGERPFKCKICSRSFTTKGNLKTHMSVHRAKPPVRMLQQCPICHKKFSNALILQQHIRLHTGEPTDFSPEQIKAAEVRDFGMDMPLPMRFPSLGPVGLSHLQPRGPFPSMALPHPFYRPMNPLKKDELPEFRPFNVSPRSSSTSSSEQHSAEDLSLRAREEEAANENLSRSVMISPTLSDYSDNEETRVSHEQHQREGDESSDSLKHNNPFISHLRESTYHDSLSDNPNMQNMSLYPPVVGFPPLTKDSAVKPPFPFFPPLGLVSSIKPSLHNMYNHLSMNGVAAVTEGHTTCKICFKVFACQSALEIHLRSHTKERPFKCSFCDRKFSTKGNLRQHMATHIQTGNCENIGNMKQHLATHKQYDSRDDKDTIDFPSIASGDQNDETTPQEGENDPLPRGDEEEDRNDLRIKREREGEIALPDPKRYSGASDVTNNNINNNNNSDEDKMGLPDAVGEGGEERFPNGGGFQGLYPHLFPPHSSVSPFSSAPFRPSLSLHNRGAPFPFSLPLSLPSPLSIPKNDSLHG